MGVSKLDPKQTSEHLCFLTGKMGAVELSVRFWLTLASGSLRLGVSELGRPNQAVERQGRLPGGGRTDVLALCKLRQRSPRASVVRKETPANTHAQIFNKYLSSAYYTY